MTVANKPGHRGEHEGNRKTIAQGMPGVSGVTVVTNSRVFSTREAAGAPGARHSLRPLIPEGGRFLEKLAHTCGGIVKLCVRTAGCLTGEGGGCAKRLSPQRPTGRPCESRDPYAAAFLGDTAGRRPLQ
jgi:hypothetical protein